MEHLVLLMGINPDRLPADQRASSLPALFILLLLSFFILPRQYNHWQTTNIILINTLQALPDITFLVWRKG